MLFPQSKNENTLTLVFCLMMMYINHQYIFFSFEVRLLLRFQSRFKILLWDQISLYDKLNYTRNLLSVLTYGQDGRIDYVAINRSLLFAIILNK